MATLLEPILRLVSLPLNKGNTGKGMLGICAEQLQAIILIWERWEWIPCWGCALKKQLVFCGVERVLFDKSLNNLRWLGVGGWVVSLENKIKFSWSSSSPLWKWSWLKTTVGGIAVSPAVSLWQNTNIQRNIWTATYIFVSFLKCKAAYLRKLSWYYHYYAHVRPLKTWFTLSLFLESLISSLIPLLIVEWGSRQG